MTSRSSDAQNSVFPYRCSAGFFIGFTLGVTWAFGALWINLGPMQVVIERA